MSPTSNELSALRVGNVTGLFQTTRLVLIVLLPSGRWYGPSARFTPRVTPRCSLSGWTLPAS